MLTVVNRYLCYTEHDYNAVHEFIEKMIIWNTILESLWYNQPFISVSFATLVSKKMNEIWEKFTSVPCACR